MSRTRDELEGSYAALLSQLNLEPGQRVQTRLDEKSPWDNGQIRKTRKLTDEELEECLKYSEAVVQVPFGRGQSECEGDRGLPEEGSELCCFKSSRDVDGFRAAGVGVSDGQRAG
jgi:hypothetical protein